MIARKRFGQHFLTRPEIVARIVRAAGVKAGDRVLEIGPGRAILTDALLAAGANLTVIEIDRDLADELRISHPTLHLVEADAARLDLRALVGPGARMVANLPYNVGTGIVMDSLDLGFRSITVMLQKEVVLRMLAEPDSEHYGSISVRVASRATGRVEFILPPGAFVPPPKVDSAVVTLLPHETPNVGTAGVAMFDTVVRAAFAQRRKTILNSLSSTFDRDEVASALASAGVAPTTRAETLDLAAFQAIAAAVAARPRSG